MELGDWCRWYERRGAGRLRRILMRQWDPIGVSGEPNARDEYDSYLGLIAERLRRQSVEDVADVLEAISTGPMAGDPRRNETLEVARFLCDWYAQEMQRAER